ncbi:carbohydrate-binding protein, partial [Thermodesulfobacteriota bacterium]
GVDDGDIVIQIMGLNGIYPDNVTLDVPTYVGAGLNTLLGWVQPAMQACIASSFGLSWHAHIRPADQGPDAWFRGTVYATAACGNGAGWMLHDEPSRLQMDGIGQSAAWVQASYPHMLTYGNAFPNLATPTQLWGDDSNPGYTWEQYLDDYVAIIHPDVLMYDYYPFEDDGSTRSEYYYNLMAVRTKARAGNLPYWAFLQSWENDAHRTPSESDLRMNVFTHLAAGYTGLAYFTYEHFQDGGLLDVAGNPTELYYQAADVNAEVRNLGPVLRMLTNEDVRYVPGKSVGGLVTNPTPNGLNDWSACAGGDPYITNVDVDHSAFGTYGLRKNGLIGLFSDDWGRRYFLLVNVNHGSRLTAAEGSLPFLVDFDGSVDELVEIDRDTGLERTVPLSDHRLSVTLLGGSGRLYRSGEWGICQAPFLGTPIVLPGTIEAEQYDLGGQGVAYNDADPGNNGGQYRGDDVDLENAMDSGGGYNVGWTHSGEWLEYTVDVADAGMYRIDVRVASGEGGGTFRILMDGVDVTGAQSFGDTGGSQNWITRTVPSEVFLDSGRQVLRVSIEQSGWTLNWIEFTEAGGGGCSIPGRVRPLLRPGQRASTALCAARVTSAPMNLALYLIPVAVLVLALRMRKRGRKSGDITPIL